MLITIRSAIYITLQKIRNPSPCRDLFARDCLIDNQACADAALTPFLQYLGFFLLMEALIIIMIEKILIKFPRISGKPLKIGIFGSGIGGKRLLFNRGELFE